MSEEKPFAINLGDLKSRKKPTGQKEVAKADRAGEKAGFVSREPTKRRGRPKSTRTAQIHAWVHPSMQTVLVAESKRRGVTQGVLLEEAWLAYCDQAGIEPPNMS